MWKSFCFYRLVNRIPVFYLADIKIPKIFIKDNKEIKDHKNIENIKNNQVYFPRYIVH
jgi:hypothetical protein